MPFLASKFRSGFDNLTVELSRVKKIQLSKPNPLNPRLWITYFWGDCENKKEKVIRTWFYQSEKERQTELDRIREKHPTLQVV
jgi:hypothetical protein